MRTRSGDSWGAHHSLLRGRAPIEEGVASGIGLTEVADLMGRLQHGSTAWALPLGQPKTGGITIASGASELHCGRRALNRVRERVVHALEFLEFR